MKRRLLLFAAATFLTSALLASDLSNFLQAVAKAAQPTPTGPVGTPTPKQRRPVHATKPMVTARLLSLLLVFGLLVSCKRAPEQAVAQVTRTPLEMGVPQWLYSIELMANDKSKVETCAKEEADPVKRCGCIVVADALGTKVDLTKLTSFKDGELVVYQVELPIRENVERGLVPNIGKLFPVQKPGTVERVLVAVLRELKGQDKVPQSEVKFLNWFCGTGDEYVETMHRAVATLDAKESKLIHKTLSKCNKGFWED